MQVSCLNLISIKLILRYIKPYLYKLTCVNFWKCVCRVILQVVLTSNYSAFILEHLCTHMNTNLLQAIFSSKDSFMLPSKSLWQHRLLLISIPSKDSSLPHYYSYIEYKILMVMCACKIQSVMYCTVADLITKRLSFRIVSSFPYLYLKILF